jgi:hypothetical protein
MGREGLEPPAFLRHCFTGSLLHQFAYLPLQPTSWQKELNLHLAVISRRLFH